MALSAAWLFQRSAVRAAAVGDSVHRVAAVAAEFGFHVMFQNAGRQRAARLSPLLLQEGVAFSKCSLHQVGDALRAYRIGFASKNSLGLGVKRLFVSEVLRHPHRFRVIGLPFPLVRVICDVVDKPRLAECSECCFCVHVVLAATLFFVSVCSLGADLGVISEQVNATGRGQDRASQSRGIHGGDKRGRGVSTPARAGAVIVDVASRHVFEIVAASVRLAATFPTGLPWSAFLSHASRRCTLIDSRGPAERVANSAGHTRRYA